MKNGTLFNSHSQQVKVNKSKRSKKVSSNKKITALKNSKHVLNNKFQAPDACNKESVALAHFLHIEELQNIT
jgi:hypothetical protein